ncbi:MAG: PA14 domain-containing protein [Candidatus Pacebacteria bacterium]|nr:PA14 domain-containing protein [Candidatus Paceibacterota bacterium]
MVNIAKKGIFLLLVGVFVFSLIFLIYPQKTEAACGYCLSSCASYCGKGDGCDCNASCGNCGCASGSRCDCYEECSTYWCWGSSAGVYYCKSGCAANGYYAPAASECCNSWNSSTKQCYSPVTCTDSDGGINYTTYGYCTDTSTKYDYCSGSYVYDYYCSGSSCVTSSYNCNNYDSSGSYCSGNTKYAYLYDYYCSGGRCTYSYSETPTNCDSYDTCSGTTYYNYYCSGGNCTYTTDSCTDCSCTCGGYGTTESTANGNCADGKDNDCDGYTDSSDTGCCKSDGTSCTAGSQCCNGTCLDSYCRKCYLIDSDGLGYYETCRDTAGNHLDSCANSTTQRKWYCGASGCYSSDTGCGAGYTCQMQTNGNPACVSVSPPTARTDPAANITTTSGDLNGCVTATGGADYRARFAWGDTTSYSTVSGWTGYYSYTTCFGIGATGLTRGRTYHFRIEAENAGGTGYGSDAYFTTKPDGPSGLTATTISGSQINLSWTNGSGAYMTMVRRSTAGYPSSPTDGTQACNTAGTSCSDPGLTSGTTYYYRAWSRAFSEESYYSDYPDSYASASATTKTDTKIVKPGSYINGIFDATAVAVGGSVRVGGYLQTVGGVAIPSQTLSLWYWTGTAYAKIIDIGTTDSNGLAATWWNPSSTYQGTKQYVVFFGGAGIYNASQSSPDDNLKVGKNNGESCTSGGDCFSNYCVDGVCCNTSCTGTCVKCNLTGAVGTCSYIPSGQDPDNECAGNTVCNGSGACTTCSSLNYPTDRWQRVWYDINGNCLGDGPDETGVSFNNDWGSGVIAYGLSDNIRFSSSRTIYFGTSGTYRFYLGSDDGSRLYVDGSLKTDLWTDHSYGVKFADVYLSAGNHTFQIEYYDRTSGARVSFNYERIPTLISPSGGAEVYLPFTVTWNGDASCYYVGGYLYRSPWIPPFRDYESAWGEVTSANSSYISIDPSHPFRWVITADGNGFWFIGKCTNCSCPGTSCCSNCPCFDDPLVVDYPCSGRCPTSEWRALKVLGCERTPPTDWVTVGSYNVGITLKSWDYTDSRGVSYGWYETGSNYRTTWMHDEQDLFCEANLKFKNTWSVSGDQITIRTDILSKSAAHDLGAGFTFNGGSTPYCVNLVGIGDNGNMSTTGGNCYTGGTATIGTTKGAEAGEYLTWNIVMGATDNNPPVATITGPDLWQNSSFTVTLNFTELNAGDSGLNTCQYKVVNLGESADSVPWKTAINCNGLTNSSTSTTLTVGPSGICHVEGSGNCKVYVRACDKATRCVGDDYSRVKEFKIDWTPPTTNVK